MVAQNNNSMEIPTGSNHSCSSTMSSNNSNSKSSSSSSTSCFLLPQSFVPHKYTIICGRGKVCTTSLGNKRLNTIIDMYRDMYAQATNKNEKTEIVSLIMEQVKRDVTSEYGLFCKIENGRYYQVKEAIVREKVGGILRDRLHTKYRSSSKAKVAKRKAIKEMNQQSLISSINMNLNTILSSSTDPSMMPTSMMSSSSSRSSSSTLNVIQALDDACDIVQQQVSSPPMTTMTMTSGFFKSMKPQKMRKSGTPRQVSIDDIVEDDVISTCSSTLSDNLFASSFDCLIPDNNTTFSASSFDW